MVLNFDSWATLFDFMLQALGPASSPRVHRAIAERIQI